MSINGRDWKVSDVNPRRIDIESISAHIYCPDEEHARHIVDCVTACTGIRKDVLRSGLVIDSLKLVEDAMRHTGVLVKEDPRE